MICQYHVADKNNGEAILRHSAHGLPHSTIILPPCGSSSLAAQWNHLESF